MTKLYCSECLALIGDTTPLDDWHWLKEHYPQLWKQDCVPCPECGAPFGLNRGLYRIEPDDVYTCQPGDHLIVGFQGGFTDGIEPAFCYEYSDGRLPAFSECYVRLVELLRLEPSYPKWNQLVRCWWEAKDLATGRTITVSAAWARSESTVEEAVQAEIAAFKGWGDRPYRWDGTRKVWL
jgi:hypothetical protein